VNCPRSFKSYTSRVLERANITRETLENPNNRLLYGLDGADSVRDSPEGGALGIVLGPRRDWYCRADRAG